MKFNEILSLTTQKTCIIFLRTIDSDTLGIDLKDGATSFAQGGSCLFVPQVSTAVTDINSVLFPTHLCTIVVAITLPNRRPLSNENLKGMYMFIQFIKEPT